MVFHFVNKSIFSIFDLVNFNRNMPYSYLTDVELWELFLSGDKKALAYIYKRQYILLTAYGLKLTDDLELVKDAIQDLFVKLYLNRKTLNKTSNINTYLIKALKHRLFDELSRSSKSFDWEELPFEFIEDDFMKDHFAEDDEKWLQKKKLKMAIDLLSPNQKEIIYLRFVRELSYEEIADILGINYQSAKNLTSRTLVKLRNNYLSL